MSVRNLKVKVKYFLIIATITWISYELGLLTHFMEEDYLRFTYPYDVNIKKLIYELRNNQTPDIPPLNSYHFPFFTTCKEKCANKQIRLVYIVKSSVVNFDRRFTIRQTWGYERRFSDVEIRTVFVLGNSYSKHIQSKVNAESVKYGDIVQVNFKDSYFNNTIKTMMSFKWAFNFCSNSRYYLFVDDDYYISTRNVLGFIRNPANYPQYLNDNDINDFELPEDVRLYAGYVFFSSPHRHLFSKWYVSLQEYAFHMWPPYVTAGAYIVSRSALFDMYFGSMYTKHFRFDDVYLGIIAKKIGIEPFHCDHFNFYKHKYSDANYRFTIASHGYESSSELSQVWNRQKSIGNA